MSSDKLDTRRPPNRAHENTLEAWGEIIEQNWLDRDDPNVDIGTCQTCGAYWDRAKMERCPQPCGGYIG